MTKMEYNISVTKRILKRIFCIHHYTFDCEVKEYLGEKLILPITVYYKCDKCGKCISKDKYI